jgi:hypothetical protein
MSRHPGTFPTPPPAPDADALRRRRHDAYVWRVNAALAAGRDGLARELADTYLDESLDESFDEPDERPT